MELNDNGMQEKCPRKQRRRGSKHTRDIAKMEDGEEVA